MSGGPSHDRDDRRTRGRRAGGRRPADGRADHRRDRVQGRRAGAAGRRDQLAAGPGSVTIGNLPATVDTASVRVAARGHDLALLNVEVRRRVGTEPLREQAARLRAEVERWRDAVQALDDEDAAEQAGLGFLGHLSEAAATALARAVGSGRAGYDELSGMAGHLSASTAGALAKRREIAARKRAAERELAAAEARLNAAEQGGEPRKVAFVEVAVDWRPRRRPKPRSTSPITCRARPGARSTIWCSTASGLTSPTWPRSPSRPARTGPRSRSCSRPPGMGQSQTLPELSPWYIGRPQPPRLPGGAVPMSASMAGEAASSGPDGPGEPQAVAFAARGQKTAAPGGQNARRRAGRERVRGRPHLHGRAPAGGARRRRTAQDPDRPVRRRRGSRLPDRAGPRARGVPAGHRHQRHRCCCSRAGPGSSTAPSSSARPTWTRSPPARSSRSSSAWTTRSRSSGSCAAAASARPCSAGPGRSTSATRSRSRTIATATPR